MFDWEDRLDGMTSPGGQFDIFIPQSETRGKEFLRIKFP